MNSSAQLSLEQQFKLKVFQEQIEKLTQQEAQEYLLEMFRLMMLKDNTIKQMLKHA